MVKRGWRRKDLWDCYQGQGRRLANSWPARPQSLSQKHLRDTFRFRFLLVCKSYLAYSSAMDCSRWKVASDAGILAIKGIPICWGILLQPFLWVVQCSFWHCLGKKKNGTWSKNTCGAVTENCPLKTGIIFKIYTDARIHYLNSCKRLDDDDYDVHSKL